MKTHLLNYKTKELLSMMITHLIFFGFGFISALIIGIMLGFQMGNTIW